MKISTTLGLKALVNSSISLLINGSGLFCVPGFIVGLGVGNGVRTGINGLVIKLFGRGVVVGIGVGVGVGVDVESLPPLDVNAANVIAVFAVVADPYVESEAFDAYTVQVPTLVAERVAPLNEQLAVPVETKVKLTAPVPLPPEVERVKFSPTEPVIVLIDNAAWAVLFAVNANDLVTVAAGP